jgi:hypothetical protein
MISLLVKMSAISQPTRGFGGHVEWTISHKVTILDQQLTRIICTKFHQILTGHIGQDNANVSANKSFYQPYWMINCIQSNYIWPVSHKEHFFQVSTIYISHTGEGLEIAYPGMPIRSSGGHIGWPIANESSNIYSGPFQESFMKFCPVVSEKEMNNEQWAKPIP